MIPLRMMRKINITIFLCFNSVMISDANSILVLYLSDSFNVPFGLNTLTINGKVILAQTP